VVAAAERDAAQLDDAQSAALGAKLISEMLQRNDSVCDAFELVVCGGAGAVVEHQHRAISASEVLLESEYLPAVTQRILRDQPQLR
jgi:hypothetical protein